MTNNTLFVTDHIGGCLWLQVTYGFKVENVFEIKFLFMLTNMATRGRQFSQPSSKGNNIFRDM